MYDRLVEYVDGGHGAFGSPIGTALGRQQTAILATGWGTAMKIKTGGFFELKMVVKQSVPGDAAKNCFQWRL